MEGVCNWENNTLINELIEGMEGAKQLRVHLNSTSSSQTVDLLLQRILCSYEKALLLLKWTGSVAQSPAGGARVKDVPESFILPESLISVDGSPGSEDFDRGFKDNQDNKDVSKKRKVLPTWTDQVKICSENGIEGTCDDGYSWRKYGQKDILGAKYPRSYYRCTYRSIQNCWATKQVQRSDEDLTIFEITYRGKHTCHQPNHSVPPPKSPEKKELKKHQTQQPNENLLNFQANLRVNTDNLEMTSPFSFPSTSFASMTTENQMFGGISSLVDNNLFGSYSPSFISPATSESNYYSVSSLQMNDFGRVQNLHHSESDLTERISTNTSSANSPIMDLDFSIHNVNLDPNFPFNTLGFLT